MKYYLIVGEASGDLHASNLMKALKEQDNQAEFRFFGGDFKYYLLNCSATALSFSRTFLASAIFFACNFSASSSSLTARI